jgi:double-stranded uracil-DNA glycosylase
MPSSGSAAAHVLPDVMDVGLNILFCGTAAGTASARRGAYYAGPGNAFWRTLYQIGLTPHLLEPADFRLVSQWSLGFTDLAKTVSGSDKVLDKALFDTDRLRTVIANFRPKIVAFTSKRAAEEFVGHRVEYGFVPDAKTVTRLFVLPSPSGAARRYWNESHWRNLASSYRCLEAPN